MIDWEHITLEDLAAYVAQELRKQGIETILVGGACVTIYSNNRYQSYDIDFATYEDMRRVKKAMATLEFHLKGRHFAHEKCPWLVEFIAPPVAVGKEPITTFEEKKLPLGTIRLLRPEDSVKDRLASYFHWNDRQGLEQAIEICLATPVDLREVEAWAVQENHQVQFEEFSKKLNQQ
jgi:hypothetical protein